MKASQIMFLGLFLLAGSVSAGTSSQQSVSLTNNGAERLIKTLKAQHERFSRLLEMRKKVDRWEKSLVTKDARLAQEHINALVDLQKLRDGKMRSSEFNRKWKSSGRLHKKDVAIANFRQEVKRYDAYRKEYNGLAKQLAVHLQNRNPKQLRSFMKRMVSLIGNLEKAIRKKEYRLAEQIAGKSRIANEFGFRSSN